MILQELTIYEKPRAPLAKNIEIKPRVNDLIESEVLLAKGEEVEGGLNQGCATSWAYFGHTLLVAQKTKKPTTAK